MSLGKVGIIFCKEMKDTLRDRRTLIFMLLVPVVAIPVLMMGMSSLMVSQITKVRNEVSQVVIEGGEYLPAGLRQTLEQSAGFDLLPPSDFPDGDLTDQLREGTFDALVVVSTDFNLALADEQEARIDLYYDQAELVSESARDKVTDLLTDYRETLVKERLTERGLQPEFLTPFTTEKHNVASAQKIAGRTFGTMLPYLIIIMCFMGAMYPAIDLAAGEKERGTLETLLVSPATRGEFVIGKYLVILTTGVVAAFLGMGSLVFSMNYVVEDMLQGMSQMLTIQVDITTILLVLMIILPLAGIFAGILLSVSIFARSFKEAQSYVTALNMIIILPAFVSFLPGMELSYQMALIPVVNASLIMKDAISGTIAWDYVLVASGANLVLAAAALAFCRKWFSREQVLFRM